MAHRRDQPAGSGSRRGAPGSGRGRRRRRPAAPATAPRGASGPVSSATSVAPSAASDQPGMHRLGQRRPARSSDPSDASCTHSSVTPSDGPDRQHGAVGAQRVAVEVGVRAVQHDAARPGTPSSDSGTTTRPGPVGERRPGQRGPQVDRPAVGAEPAVLGGDPARCVRRQHPALRARWRRRRRRRAGSRAGPRRASRNRSSADTAVTDRNPPRARVRCSPVATSTSTTSASGPVPGGDRADVAARAGPAAGEHGGPRVLARQRAGAPVPSGRARRAARRRSSRPGSPGRPARRRPATRRPRRPPGPGRRAPRAASRRSTAATSSRGMPERSVT